MIDTEQITAQLARMRAKYDGTLFLCDACRNCAPGTWPRDALSLCNTITALLEELQWRQLCPQKLVDAERALDQVRGERRDLTERVAALLGERQNLLDAESQAKYYRDEAEAERDALTARVAALEGERDALLKRAQRAEHALAVIDDLSMIPSTPTQKDGAS